MSKQQGTGQKMKFVAGVAIASALVAGAAEAEERVLVVGKWYPSLEGGINLTQSAYSDNWSGGDRGSIVWTGIVNGLLENQIDPKVNWNNVLKLAYGQTHQQGVQPDGTRNWDQPEKSTDLVDYETIFRFTLGKFVDPFFSARLESQFQDASDPAGRNLALNPLKFKETAGIARKFIDEEERQLLSRLGFSFRQSVRRTFTTPADAIIAGTASFDDATTSLTSNDGGLEFVTDYKTKVLEDRVAWTSKLTFYQPVFYSGKDELDDQTAEFFAANKIDPDVASFSTTLDVDFENIFTTQITKLISVSLYTRWLYDKFDNSVSPELAADGTLTKPGDVRAGIRKAGQFKQTLSIGVTYRFL